MDIIEINNISEDIKNEDLKSSAKEVFNLNANPKQREFFKEVMKAAQGQSDFRYFFFGGAVRGGKTSICLIILYFLCRKFPGLRCHVIRDSGPSLIQTTIPSFTKLCGNKFIKKWNRSSSNQHVEFTNGSKIYFFPEGYAQDKDLDRFKGLETNIIMLEQVEELQQITFQKSIERVGSWYIDNTPPGIILATFNPTHNWLKEQIHDKHVRKELKAPYFYLQALPNDNPFVTQDQWKGWANMDEISYKRFVEGDWEARNSSGVFAYAFNDLIHVQTTQFNPKMPLWLSFDFNVTPMTALAIQYSDTTINILKEFKLHNTSIQEFTHYVKNNLPITINHPIYVTGDPAGQNRSGTAHNTNYYIIIKNILNLTNDKFKILTAPPTHENSQVLVNSVIQNYPNFNIDPSAKALIQDLKYVKFFDLNIAKNQKSMIENDNNSTMGHLLDCLRYFIHVNLNSFVKKVT